MSIRQNRMLAVRGRKALRYFDVNIRKALPILRDRAGWILVGGRSTRMGMDKAILDIEGIPMVLRIAAEIRKVCGSVSLVGDPAVHGRLGLPVVRDDFPGEGPLAGIEAALRSTGADWNLVVACDMPSLDVSTFEALFTETGDVAVPKYEEGRIEPLCAVYHRRCHAAIRAALEAGIRKVTDALQTLEITYIPVLTSAPFANLNTPDDLRKYKHG